LMVLFVLQSVFIAMRGSAPEVAALHPVNGFLIILVALVSGREAWAAWRARRPEVVALPSRTVEEPGAGAVH
jgi:hypothetical protein